MPPKKKQVVDQASEDDDPATVASGRSRRQASGKKSDLYVDPNQMKFGGDSDSGSDGSTMPPPKHETEKKAKGRPKAGKKARLDGEIQKQKKDESFEEKEEESDQGEESGAEDKKVVAKKRDIKGKPVKEEVKAAKKDGMKAIPEKKMMIDDEARTAIAEYMEKQNRPYSVQNVIDNLHGRIKKVQAQKILDELSDDKILVCKEYGKAKIYLINQDNQTTCSNEELKVLDDQIAVRREELQGLQTSLKSAQGKLKEVTSSLTNEQLAAEIKKYSEENEQIEKELLGFQNGDFKLVTEEEISVYEQKLKKYCLEWKKRKRGCMEVLDTIAENADINRRELMVKVGVETDEEMNVSINEISV